MSIFKFKQFAVDQTGCAMKINTDGVLLGATVSHPSPQRILDIGTGTGVIALMLAQRFPGANIHAVEIDEQAAKTAERNFQQSPFNHRLTINNIAIEQYIHSEQFDLIVSNPPFFVNDLKNEEVRKGIARHAESDFFDRLIEKTAGLLTANGKLWLILPVKQAQMVIARGALLNLKPCVQINLHSDKNKATFRQIVCLSKAQLPCTETDFYIYESLKENTVEYKALLKDFFLAY